MAYIFELGIGKQKCQLLCFDFFKFYFKFMAVYLFVCQHSTCVAGAAEIRRMCWIPRNWNYRR